MAAQQERENFYAAAWAASGGATTYLETIADVAAQASDEGLPVGDNSTVRSVATAQP